MPRFLSYITRLFLILLLLLPGVLYGQYYLYNDAPINIDATFTRHSIEATAKQTFFNVLKIKNKSNRSEYLTLNITVPQGWGVIGDNKIDVSLSPLDSTFIPLRFAVSSRVRGDIGYSVIASLTDNRGNTIKNVYCFVKIPRKTDIQIKLLNRLIYLDPESERSEFSVLISNKGNREEPVNIFIDGIRQLEIGSHNQLQYAQDVSIPPYTDSTITYQVKLRQDEFLGRDMLQIKTKFTTIDTSYQSTIWARRLESELKNKISSLDKPLTIELIGRGLLDVEKEPSYSAIISGKTLFKGNSELYYYYQNYSSRTKKELIDNTRMYLGGSIGPFKMEVGDNFRTIESNMNGRGVYLSFNNSKIGSEFIANKEQRSNYENIGSTISYNFNPKTYLKSGFAYVRNKTTDFESKLGYLSSNFTILKHHSFSVLLASNLIKRDIDGKKTHNEYGGEFNYFSKIGKFITTAKSKYGSELYYSPQNGRLNISVNTQWYINPKNRLVFSIVDNKSRMPKIVGTSLLSTSEMGNKYGKVEYIYFARPSISTHITPYVESYRASGLESFPTNSYFESVGYKIILGLRIRNLIKSSTLSPSVEIARNNILNNPFANVDGAHYHSKWFNYQYFSLNFRNRMFNVLAFYTSGPRSIFDQILYAYINKPNRKFQFIPSFEKLMFKEQIKVSIGLSYTNDMVAKSSYSNLTGQIFWYLPQNWSAHVLSVYSLQSRTNPQSFIETYQSFYLEAGIRKEFDIQHPRVKFYNIELHFFKDFNGNYIKDSNEPGIKNILVNISKDSSDIKGSIPGDFSNAELISDNLGRVFLEKIPEGIYNIIYNPIGKDAGTFSKALEVFTLKVDKNNISYIPFVEKNKVFGKIILNRSKLSGLGKVDVSNVRITSTDSRGRTYTTLTDKNGEFVLFAPVTDQYIVNINNIFYENFDLRQNNFKVQFNGYKQFEVNFVYDEKIRRVNFSPSSQDAQLANVLQVRRTNIKGTVKDESSLLPIRSRVNLVNTKSNTVLTSMYSSSQTGDYNLSFMADDNYLLEVLADGYWYHSENLNLNQVTTFLNITKDILLKPITIGSKIELNIKFDINKIDLTPEAVAELNRLVKLLKDNGNIKIEVQGHSDDLEALNNPQISEERAKKVARYLIENGFSNLQIRGFGNTVPLSSNDTEQGREANRRVEVEVVSK